jgi:predicted MFS family arabinose efflux permease
MLDWVSFVGSWISVLGSCLFFIGNTMWSYVPGILLVGVGWAFSFISSSAAITYSYIPPEKLMAQGVNDTLLFLGVTAASVAAGFIYTGAGWFATVGINLGLEVLGMVLTIGLIFLFRSRRSFVKSRLQELGLSSEPNGNFDLEDQFLVNAISMKELRF